MAFFNNDNLYGCTGVACAEGVDVDLCGLSKIVEENCMAELEVVKAMHQIDMAEIGTAYKVKALREASGDDSDVEDEIADFESTKEGAIKDIFNKIKEALKKFFSNVFGFFKRLWDKLVTFRKSNKSFAEKYKPIVENLSEYIKGVTYEGFDYNLDGMAAKMESYSDEASEAMSKSLQTISKFANDASTDNPVADAKEQLTQLTASIDEDDTSNEELKSEMRGASKKTITYSGATIVKNLDVLEKLDLKQVKKYESEAKKSYSDTLSVISTCEAKFNKAYASNKMDSRAHAYAKLATEAKSTITRGQTLTLRCASVFRECVIDFANQIKRVTIKAIAEGRAKKKAADKKD